MSNSDQSEKKYTWQQINLSWWQINASLWFLVGLLFLYFRLPTTADLTRNIIVGGLILTLIVFLGVAVPKVVMSSLTKALSQRKNSLFAEISSKLEDVLNKTREEREEQSKKIIKTITGGPIVQGLTSNRPAAVESAAANPPAATKATTQLGKPAISGFAKTMISLSMVNSFLTLSFWYRIIPS